MAWAWIAAIAWGHWMMFYFFEDNEALRELEKRFMKGCLASLYLVMLLAILYR